MPPYGRSTPHCKTGRAVARDTLLIITLAATGIAANTAVQAQSYAAPISQSRDKTDGNQQQPAPDHQDTGQAPKPVAGQLPENKPDNSPPAVNPGRPTVTEPAALTAPGWLQTEFGLQQDLDRNHNLGTPLAIKLTSGNRHLEYRLATDGYVRQGDRTDGIGDTYTSLQYLFATQDRAGYDVAGRFTFKLPTASSSVGGTRKVDYASLLMASRDYTKWGLHGDFNLAFANLSRFHASGTDNQFYLTAAFTYPIRGGRWAYQNELAYFSPIAGQRSAVTTMHVFAYAAHRYEVYDIGVQWQLRGAGPVFQFLIGRTFYLGRLF